jgi:hypothetical protein
LNIDDGWMAIFDEIDQWNEEEYQDNCHFIDRDASALFVNEVKNMSHSGGKVQQEKYRYPDGNDTSFPQEKSKGNVSANTDNQCLRSFWLYMYLFIMAYEKWQKNVHFKTNRP